MPKFCSTACKSRQQRKDLRRKEYERSYRRWRRAQGLLRAYEWEYNRRPEVKARNRERARVKWHTDPEYRARQLARWGDKYRDVVIPAPYTGHRWLEMARSAVCKDVDPDSSKAEQFYDEMGEALLALLEGRDMREALYEYRKREYVPRHLTIHLGEWKDDEDEGWPEDYELPSEPSAEEEAVARETVTHYLKTRYHHGKNGRPMKGGRNKTQPSIRRMRDGKSWMKHAYR